jgi:hydroxymethylpyrimidine/phosphomethylpyrimidine kinase
MPEATGKDHRRKRRSALLSIAGFDPTGGAGVIADAAVFRTLGFHPLTTLSSVTAQNSRQVEEVHPLTGEFIARELTLTASEFSICAVKVGMLYSVEAVEVVAAFLQASQLPAVLDPVLKASSGGDLADPAAIPFMESRLMPLCRMVTPNLAEAEYFLGHPISSLEEVEQAAQELSWLWNTAVLLKGGHFPGEPVDILAEGREITTYAHSRSAETMNLRGTGCALSAAVTAGFGMGFDNRRAVDFAVKFIQDRIRDSYISANDETIGFLPI